MAGELYGEYAVEQVWNWLAPTEEGGLGNLATQLATLRAAQTPTVAALDLLDPKAVIKAPHLDDARSPLVMVFDVGGAFDDQAGGGQRNRMFLADLNIAVQIMSTPDLELGHRTLRRYLTAILATFHPDHGGDPTLGDTVNAILIGDYSIEPFTERQTVWMQLVLEVTARVRTP